MTHNPRLEIRPATIDDIKSFYGIDRLGPSLRALAFFYDGKLAGIGGVRFQHGLNIVFSDSMESVKAPPATVYRCGIAVMNMAKSMGVPLVALRDGCVQGSDRFLQAMGFKFYEKSDNGDVYKWQD